MLALAVSGATPAAGADNPRRALLIGNDTYPTLPALPVCAASIHVVSATLRRAGFEITERLNVSNGEMGAAIAAFSTTAAAAADSSAVLYVCGYAIDFDGRDFLLPASARIDRDTDALTQGLAVKSLLDAMARSGARARLVLLDAVIARNGGSALHLDALAQTPPRTVGFAAAVSTAPLPQGPTAFAAAIAASLIPPDVELGALLHAIQARLNGGATSLTIAVPPGSFWVAGGPPQPAEPPAPVPAPPVPAPPAPAPPAPAVPAVVAPVVTMPDEDHMTEADRRRIQSALLRLGYYDRQVDGVFGADTRAAIRRFQHEIGAPMTGRITPEQSGRLLADPR